MSIQPIAPPHPLTVAEYLAIGEIPDGSWCEDRDPADLTDDDGVE